MILIVGVNMNKNCLTIVKTIFICHYIYKIKCFKECYLNENFKIDEMKTKIIKFNVWIKVSQIIKYY